jgi:hypothetical protein
LVSVPVVEEPTTTTMVTVVEALGTRSLRLHVTVPPDSLQPADAELNVTPVGRVSVRTTFGRGD